MAVKDEPFGTNSTRAQAALAVGGLLGALAASSCCILPVALFSLGISGAWIANFTQLAPYKPYFVAAAVVLLTAGYWLVRRSTQRACAGGEACARPLPTRIVKIVLVAATALVIVAAVFDCIAPHLLS
jgi:mercuric ion transport protein